MWTWGDGDFGRAWCNNLTDNGDRYIELMTGTFTDNQPDFTYIMPGEVKTFSMVWYPVREIGPVSNATRDAALSFSKDGDLLKTGLITTSAHPAAHLSICAGGQEIYTETCAVDPDHAVLREISLPKDIPETDIKVCLSDETGRILVGLSSP